MEECTNTKESLNVDKEQLISILTEELPVLRTKVGLSQDELSNIIGISRQTYSSIETNKKCLGMFFTLYSCFLDIAREHQRCLKHQGHFRLN